MIECHPSGKEGPRASGCSCRKKRWLDFDGLNWCSLRGGPNSATYMKPMVDYFDSAKLAYYTVGMSFQRVLAESRNVDVTYGPEDKVPVALALAAPLAALAPLKAKAEPGSPRRQRKPIRPTCPSPHCRASATESTSVT